MKEIADRTEMAASVLSSLYSSVLPTYIGEVKRGIIPKGKIPEELMPYYDYTCQTGDFIKTCTVPSPSLDAQDLKREKKMLEL